MTSAFAIKELRNAEGGGAGNNRKRLGLQRTMTSFGTSLDQDDMILEREEDDEAPLQNTSSQTALKKKEEPQPQRLNKDFGVFLILKSRFGNETHDKKFFMKRKDELIKDLSLNMLTGKITRETYFHEDIPRVNQLSLIKALQVEPGTREVDQYKVVEPYLRSLKMFKPYADFESADFYSLI